MSEKDELETVVKGTEEKDNTESKIKTGLAVLDEAGYSPLAQENIKNGVYPKLSQIMNIVAETQEDWPVYLKIIVDNDGHSLSWLSDCEEMDTLFGMDGDPYVSEIEATGTINRPRLTLTIPYHIDLATKAMALASKKSSKKSSKK